MDSRLAGRPLNLGQYPVTHLRYKLHKYGAPQLKPMKTAFVSLILICGITAAHADLTMELNLTAPKMNIVVKIKGDKIRYDFLPDGGYGNMSRIVDVKMGDDFILDHVPKRIVNHPFIPSDYTNAIAKTKWPELQDTDKTEIMNGYEAEIYKWTNADGIGRDIVGGKKLSKLQQNKKRSYQIRLGQVG